MMSWDMGMFRKRGDWMARETQIICTNVFKNDREEKLKEEFTQKWIELIHQIEKNKERTTVSN